MKGLLELDDYVEEGEACFRARAELGRELREVLVFLEGAVGRAASAASSSAL
jgi:hypothetical protein